MNIDIHNNNNTMDDQNAPVSSSIPIASVKVPPISIPILINCYSPWRLSRGRLYRLITLFTDPGDTRVHRPTKPAMFSAAASGAARAPPQHMRLQTEQPLSLHREVAARLSAPSPPRVQMHLRARLGLSFSSPRHAPAHREYCSE